MVEALDAGDLGLTVDDELATLPLGAEAAQWRDAPVADARRLLYLLDRRAGTLRRVTAAALEVQEDFVRHGRAAHRPLTRAQVAERENEILRKKAGMKAKPGYPDGTDEVAARVTAFSPTVWNSRIQV
ncbi:hypothetical protein, partial [Bradyrhizobium sp. NBAIM08]|uniref:RNA polymerase factor sigma-54 n=1 Tax=Bradyrhizobium sp. NBAIM08 TaxID=2793815 RepID=UPI001CD3D5F1|nr:hypothetical protein [Bradyrhizobium sp. NBAIM08]